MSSAVEPYRDQAGMYSLLCLASDEVELETNVGCLVGWSRYICKASVTVGIATLFS